MLPIWACLRCHLCSRVWHSWIALVEAVELMCKRTAVGVLGWERDSSLAGDSGRGGSARTAGFCHRQGRSRCAPTTNDRITGRLAAFFYLFMALFRRIVVNSCSPNASADMVNNCKNPRRQPNPCTTEEFLYRTSTIVAPLDGLSLHLVFFLT